jgi:hypothetical protein
MDPLQTAALKALAEFTSPMHKKQAWNIANACIKEGVVKNLLAVLVRTSSLSVASE